jgi:hypothetical protein
MPQFIIRADHTVRVFPAVALGSASWCVTAVLTLTQTDEIFEATSIPCQTPQAAAEAALAQVVKLPDFRARLPLPS